MRINLRYAAVAGILAASLSTLGPVAAQASQISGTSVPAASQTANRTAVPNYRCGYGGFYRYGNCRYMHGRYCRGYRGYYGHYRSCFSYGHYGYAESASRMRG